jgi:hypothetical protein
MNLTPESFDISYKGNKRINRNGFENNNFEKEIMEVYESNLQDIINRVNKWEKYDIGNGYSAKDNIKALSICFCDYLKSSNLTEKKLIKLMRNLIYDIIGGKSKFLLKRENLVLVQNRVLIDIEKHLCFDNWENGKLRLICKKLLKDYRSNEEIDQLICKERCELIGYLLNNKNDNVLTKSCVRCINDYCNSLYLIFNTYKDQISIITEKLSDDKKTVNIIECLGYLNFEKYEKIKNYEKFSFLFELFAQIYNISIKTLGLAFDNMSANKDYVLIFTILSSVYLPKFHQMLKVFIYNLDWIYKSI